MPYIPKDSRVNPDFEVVRGMGATTFITERDLKSTSYDSGTDTYTSVPCSDTIELGEPLRIADNSGSADPSGFDPRAVYPCRDSISEGASDYYRVVGFSAQVTSNQLPLFDRVVGLAWDEYNKETYPLTSAKRRDRISIVSGEFIAKIAVSRFGNDTVDDEDIAFYLDGSVVTTLEHVAHNSGSRQVGDDVVVLSRPNNEGYYFYGLTTRAEKRYPVASNPAKVDLYNIINKNLDRAVVGKIIDVDSEFITVRFSL